MPKRLLLIDPIPTHRIRLKAALRAAQYDVVSVDRISCATGAMVERPADLILLNTSGADPAQMMTRLTKAIGPTEIPVLCRDEDAGPLRRIQALATGAEDMVATRVPLSLLLARLRGLLRDNEAASELERRRMAAASFGFREAACAFDMPGRVLAVTLGSPEKPDNHPALSSAYRMRALRREELLHDGGQIDGPDAILLNVGRDGREQLDAVLPEIRARSHLRQAPVLVLYPADAFDVAHHALNLGASEIAEDTSSDRELMLRIDSMLARKRVTDALRRSTEESFRLAATDALTGLYNRRYAEVYLADTLSEAIQTGRGFTVMIVDLDHFKSVNDRYGHAAGDIVLKSVAVRIRDNLRAKDLVSRHGGEEFLVILPEIDGPEAELAAERLRAEISRLPVDLADGTRLVVTASIGVAWTSFESQVIAPEAPGEERSNAYAPLIDDLLKRADRALYAAKAAGRDRISVSPLSASAA